MTFPELIKILRQESFSLEAAWKIRREFNYYRFDSGAGKADGLEAAAGKYKDDLFARKFMRHRLSSGFFLFPAGEYREVYAKMMPAQRKQVIAAADLICRNRIPVFGEFADFGSEEINWQRDYKNDYCWDSQVLYYRKKSAGEVVKENRADVKIPWELSRLQFLSFLGIAYWLTDEKQYAREFSRLVNDWIDNNPPYRGINWACAMEVAIRAVNLIWGVAFFLDCPEISDELIYRIRKVLICSHRFIKGNLERKFRASGNHYLADLTGLIHLGIFLPDDCGDDLSWALDELYSEICRQVYLDGVSFEASTGYHRLALELFYSSALLCEVNKISFPDPFWEILSRMFGYARACRKPDLTACRFGDNDSGRLLSFALREDNDHSYLPGIACLFDRVETKAGDFQVSPEALWLFGPHALKAAAEKQEEGTDRAFPRAFPQGGRFFLQDKNIYVAVSCGGNGFYGLGSHAHNDKLSFELNRGGLDFIVDPGTGTYTADLEERRLFRSTAYHNTVRVDRIEQNDISENEPFLMKNQAEVGGDLEETGSILRFRGFQGGYRRLRNPVMHHREITLDRKKGILEIQDRFEGTGRHLLEWYFHLHPEVSCAMTDEGVKLRREKILVEFTVLRKEKESFPPAIEIRESWYSPGYNRKIDSKHLYFSREVDMPHHNNKIILNFLNPNYSG